MKSFARVTKLSNVGGRADYISDPKRQESIVAASAPVDWKPYQEFEMANQKTEKRNNEGREVVLALPNEWAALSRDELSRRAEKLAVTAAGKSTDMQWAVHWNKAHTNLHMHVIFSERQKKKDRGVWDRDVYLTEDGKVARTKAQRARLPDGTIAPPVHRKGEEKGGFTAKDTKYKSRAWVPAMKQQLREQFAALGVVVEKPKLLHEFHEGKGSEAPLIRQKNEVIRENNNRLEALASRGMDAAKHSKTLAGLLKQGKVPVLYVDESNRLRVTYFTTPAKAVALMEQTKGQIQPMQQREVTPAAAPTHVDQPQPSVSFAALGEAAREYYRETFALHDTRRPLDPAVQKAPADLQGAFADLQAARDRASHASFELSRCRFWEKDKKQTARAELAAANRECQDAFDRVTAYGISKYQDGAEQSGTNVDMEQLQGRVKWKVEELQRAADYEAKHARPADAPYGSPERHRAAQERFERLCREIPPARREAAREAIKDALTASDRGTGMGAAMATAALRKTTDKLLPEQRSQTQTLSREQGRSR